VLEALAGGLADDLVDAGFPDSLLRQLGSGLEIGTSMLVAGCDTPVRIFISMVVLTPMGFFMGMAFPLGMRLAAARSSALTPWLWGINGATSVYASVLAVIVAISFGVSASYWTGLACYLTAFAAFCATSRGAEQRP
jgi:hypothetical protein